MKGKRTQLLIALLALLCMGLVASVYYQMFWAEFSLVDFVERGVLVGFTAALVLLVHRLLLYRVPPSYLLCIWLIVLLQFAGVQLPRVEGASYGLGSQLPTVTVQAQNTPPPQTLLEDAAIGQDTQDKATLAPQDVTVDDPSGEMQNVSYTQQIARGIQMIWCGGAVLLLGWFLCNYFYFVRRVARQNMQLDEEALANVQTLLKQAKQAVGLAQDVPLCMTVQDGPLLLGVLRPRIILPVAYCVAGDALYLMLLHELVHRKHWDNLWSVLAVLALATQWYNPLVWFCFFVLKRDMERRCDAAVVALGGDKKAYATVLLQSIQA